jgi:PAS domain S-box-containing protein
MNNRLALTSEQLESLFPFHIVFDRELAVVQFGISLSKIIPDISEGARLGDLLEMERPGNEMSLEVFEKSHNTLFLFFNRANECRLRGEVIRMENGHFLWIGSPWLTSSQQMRSFGLSIRDFATYDPVVDMLQLLQNQKIALNDLTRLASELKKQRLELRQKEQEARKLALVASRTKNAVIITDRNGQIEWVNEGFSRMTGYQLEEVAGRKPGSFLQGPLTRKDVVARIRRYLDAGEGFREELINYSKSGSPYWVQIEVQPIHDEKGVVTQYMAIEADITHEKESAERIQREKDLLELTLASISEAVLTTSGDGTIELMNEAAASLFGLSPRVAVGKPVQDFIRLTELNGKAVDLDFSGRQHPDGDLVTGDVFDLQAALILTNYRGRDRRVTWQFKRMEPGFGTDSRILIVFRDVEEEFEVQRMKTDFVSSVSHELRTPLTSIKGFIATILKDPEMPEETRNHFLRIINDQSNRLQDLVDDLLEISRLESGRIPFDCEEMDPLEVLIKAASDHEMAARRAEIQFVTDLPDSLPPLRGDSGKLRSAISNLISNAIKFTPAGGTVTVLACATSDSIHIQVRDTGMGVPEKDQERIFQKFFRVNRPGSEIKGTGLGLAIVKAVIDSLGGKIRVESSEGLGSSFFVTIPFITPQSGPDPTGGHSSGDPDGT